MCDTCGNLLDPRDIELDGNEIWTVDTEGSLGYVTDPAVSLAEMSEAIEEYLESSDSAYGQLASLERHRVALMAFLDARSEGIKPRPTYTWVQVYDAVNEGADVVNDSLGLGEPESDAINLAVNAAIACLEKPGTSFEEMIESNYSDDTTDEIRSWWGWGK
ncbi:hypothetical protein QMK19_34015 [Streptomyces sp. H10-C2]|uniref:hypothetical protein n=1 Tax=unclassified Streptomyces TaxID=2593676 RepID=UPI0024B9FEE0|nr:MULTISPECIES: hypothetical protein [unclassified Streptomyces]MDJ0345565.1 hypothetical protein [Streptomyces sp. PH10-H1]MDJ0374511.1 hypothetical protein [Streptomyces sp. H10-C2]